MSNSKRIYKWERGKLKEVDRSLYLLFYAAYELRLISSAAFQHACTAETNLLVPIEEV